MMDDKQAEKHEVLEDIVHTQEPGNIEFIEWLVEQSYIPKREIIQSYMIWKFKWNWKIADTDEAALRWAESGMAKAYAEQYDGRCTPRTMYQRMVEHSKKIGI